MGSALKIKDASLVDARIKRIEGTIYAVASPSHRRSCIYKNIHKKIDKFTKKKRCDISFSDLDIATNGYNKDAGKDFNYESNVILCLIIICKPGKVKYGRYYNVQKFIAKVTISSTSKKRCTVKLRIYESLLISEYWLVHSSNLLDIYYLENGRYKLHSSLVLASKDKEYMDSSNKDLIITLRALPKISTTLGKVFE